MFLPRRWFSKILFPISVFLVLVTFVHFLASYSNTRPKIPVDANIEVLQEAEDVVQRAHKLGLEVPAADDPRRGCVMPKLKRYNPVYQANGYKEKAAKNVVCRSEPDWLQVTGGKISFTAEAMKKYPAGMTCTINYMERKSDFEQKRRQPSVAYDSSNGSAMSLEHDFLWADCKSKPAAFLAPKYRWNDLLAGIKVRDNVLQRRDPIPSPSPESLNSKNGGKKLNLLMFGFDSVSHVNFMRRLPNLYSYLTNDLGGIVLDNYNIVGDGTTAAILAALAGSYEEELPETRRGKSRTMVDVYPFVFKEFKDKRYVTAYAEDESSIGTFQYRLNGFKDQPADHYMRPFQLQAEKEHKHHPVYCLGAKPKINVLMDWLEGVFTQYPQDVGKFAFGFHSEYSHGVVEELSLADDPVTTWIKHLNSSGVLDNTILMLMSDHGHRFSFTRSTLQGKYEERLPFFSIVLPAWFKERFPNSYKSLQVNALDRLTTPFDIHETFLSVLNDLNAGVDVGAVAHDPNKLTRGLSLFREIPVERSCEDAKVSSHWCACNSWKQVNQKDDPLVIRAADAIVQEINHLIHESGKSHLCSQLSLKQITRSMKMIPKKEMLAFKESSDHDGRVPDLTDKTDVSTSPYSCFRRPNKFFRSKSGGGD